MKISQETFNNAVQELIEKELRKKLLKEKISEKISAQIIKFFANEKNVKKMIMREMQERINDTGLYGLLTTKAERKFDELLSKKVIKLLLNASH